MSRSFLGWYPVVVLSCLLLLGGFGPAVNAELIENFDDPGTTAFSLDNSSGSPPAVMNGGATGNFARLTNLDGSNNNSIAFDEEPTQTGPAPGGLRLAFDFRMTDDQANADAGGCCGSAADGLGLGVFATDAYGTSGPINPGASDGDWERPVFAAAFAVGFDIFQNIDVVSLNWDGVQVAEADVQAELDLNSGRFHRAVVTLTPSGTDALATMDIIQDVQGLTILHNIFADQLVPGLDLANLPGYRLMAGGRTGGAFAAGDIDNIALITIPVPEPTTIVLLGLGSILLLVVRRRAA
jgi:hypothetical protein